MSVIQELRRKVPVGSQFHMPGLVWPCEPRIHPDHELICARNQAWVRELMPFSSPQIAERIMAHRVDQFVAQVYPTCDLEPTITIADMSQLEFFLDDQHMTDAKPVVEIIEALHLCKPLTNAYGPAFNEVWGRMQAGMPQPLRERCRASLVRFYQGFLIEDISRNTGALIAPEGYLDLRLDSLGMEHVAIYLEYGLGIDLTSLMADDDELATLWRKSGEIIIVHNDVHSFWKELCAGDPTANLVAILIHHGRTLQQAVDEAVGQAHAAYQAFASTSARIRARYQRHPSHADITAYLVGQELAIVGDVRWEFETTRYHGTDHVWDGLVKPLVTLLPDGATAFSVPLWEA